MKYSVVGLSAKTPAGDDAKSMWENALFVGNSFIKKVGLKPKDGKSAHFGYASLLEEHQRTAFDPNFWNVTPAQAAEIDPQTRWILEGVWNAVVDSKIEGGMDHLRMLTVGVFCGIMNNDMKDIQVASSDIDFSLNATTGSVAGLVSHIFGFQGPSLDVNTMCSSGLVALDLAVQSLKQGKCEVAFVAAANWLGGIEGFSSIGSLGALSFNGLQDCLGSNPNGYVRGEACVVLMIQADNNRNPNFSARCSIESIASTHHGSGARNFFAKGKTHAGGMSVNVATPSTTSYINSYKKCLFELEPHLAPEDVSYIEMHATGTNLGDKAEIDSLREFYATHIFTKDMDEGRKGEETPHRAARKLWVGSSKSIFGHTEPVSGLLSIVKLCLAFEYDLMPPSFFLSEPSQRLNKLSKDCDIGIVDAPLPLSQMQGRLFAVTASGMSGTTSHVIIGMPDKVNNIGRISHPSRPSLLTIESSSIEFTKRWSKALSASCKNSIKNEDSLFSAHMLPKSAPKATLTLASFDEDAHHFDVSKLSLLPSIRQSPLIVPASSSPGNAVASHCCSDGTPYGNAEVCFAFGGVGLVQYGVGRRLYEEWPAFAFRVNEVDKLFQEYELFRGQSVASLVGMTKTKGFLENSEPAQKVLPTKLMQPATFLVQYAEAMALLDEFQIKLKSVVGHSFGEIPAAVVGGAITLKQGVAMTIARTESSLRAEEVFSMGMLLCHGWTMDHVAKVIADIPNGEVCIAGYMSELEFILSGNKTALEKCQQILTTSGVGIEGSVVEDTMAMWIDSTVAFHSKFVSGVAEDLENFLTSKGYSYDQQDSAESIKTEHFLMTSVGGEANANDLRGIKFWVDSVREPIHFDSVINLLCKPDYCNGPLIDLSPRGLVVNWCRRNKTPSELNGKVVTAPSFSWDFARVLQHYRKHQKELCQQSLLDVSVQDKNPYLPALPFEKRKCVVLPQDTIVRTATSSMKEVDGAKSVYNEKMLFETHHVPVTDSLLNKVSFSLKLEDAVAVEFMDDWSNLWNCIWQGGNDGAKITMETLKNKVADTNEYQNCFIVVTGPNIKGTCCRGLEEDPSYMEKAVEIVLQVQELLMDPSFHVKGVLLITCNETSPSYEFISGSIAAFRLQIPMLSFVTTVRVDCSLELLSKELLEFVLAYAQSGEADMVVSKDAVTLLGRRVRPLTKELRWDASWVQRSGLYVVSGATGHIASHLLPSLASIGVQKLLLLSNHRVPSKSLICELQKRGATSIISKHCSLLDEEKLSGTITDALRESNAERVAGVFHLAAVEEENQRLPITYSDCRRIIDVKYQGHLNLIKCTKLKAGDIFCVPGSISQLIGAGGAAYTAVNYSCRALQLWLISEQKLTCPYPMLGISSDSLENSKLLHDMTTEKLQQTGLLSSPSQSFNIAQFSSLCVPSTSDGDVIVTHIDPERMHDYLNATSPNNVLLELAEVAEAERLSKVSLASLKRTFVTGYKLVHGSPNRGSNISDAHNNETFKDNDETLNPRMSVRRSLSIVTGLSMEEVAELEKKEDAFIDETFSIDSISSVRLRKQIEKHGFDLGSNGILFGTYGDLLNQVTMAPRNRTPSFVSTKGNEDDATKQPLSHRLSTSTYETKESTIESLDHQEDVTDTRTLASQIQSDSDMFVSSKTMKHLCQGHKIATGEIVGSFWYALEALQTFKAFEHNLDVHVSLFRMTYLSQWDQFIVTAKARGARNDESAEKICSNSAMDTLLFETYNNSNNETLLRAQATSYPSTLVPVPLIDVDPPSSGTMKKVQSLSGTHSIYNVWARQSGFAYEGNYRSLKSMAFFVEKNREERSFENIQDIRVMATAAVGSFAGNVSSSSSLLSSSTLSSSSSSSSSLDLPSGSTLSELSNKVEAAEAFFISVDAVLQSMVVGSMATFAPAKWSIKLHKSLQDVVALLKDNHGDFTISARYKSASRTHMEGVATAYIIHRNDTINPAAPAQQMLFTVQCLNKSLPIALGAELSPVHHVVTSSTTTQPSPRHTMICFHEAGGTSHVYDTLGSLLAPHGVRVVTVDMPHHGRRSQQTDESLITSVEPMVNDIMPWMRHLLLLREDDNKDDVELPLSEQNVVPFSLVGLSSGGTVAFTLLQEALMKERMIPKSIVLMMSQPPHFSNEHAERTYDATVENVGNILSYYSIVAGGGIDLTHLNEGKVTADRCRSVLGIVHDVTNRAIITETSDLLNDSSSTTTVGGIH